ncbi:MAG: YeeE/YedE family protein [Alphaproteobacteria bacterium]|nr:MAG: YeeE/YedE family protein [Alphaproteobacteria bacterium]
MRQFLAALVLGLLFGLGLSVGSMTNPQKILAFLDIAGQWDPSLALLMGAAVVVTFGLYRIAYRMPRPLLAPRFSWPRMTRVDLPVILGPAIFGVGWGIAGVCPGPGLLLMVTNPRAAAWFVPTLLVGLWLGRPHHRRARQQAEKDATEPSA